MGTRRQSSPLPSESADMRFESPSVNRKVSKIDLMDEESVSPTTVFAFETVFPERSVEYNVNGLPFGEDSGEQGFFDLIPMIEAREWKRLKKVLAHMELNSSDTDIQATLGHSNERGETPLHTAAWKAPTKLVLSLLELISLSDRKKYLLALDCDGNTPLHLACANLDERIEFSVIKNLLVLAPESLDAKNVNGDTPLHLLASSRAFQKSPDFAIEAAAEEAISSLIKMSRRITTATNNNGATLLHVAIGYGAHERVLVRLIQNGPKAAQIADNHGLLPLHYVAAFGGTPWTVAEELIRIYPGSLCAQTADGDTPLHLLMSNAHKFLKKDQFLDRNTTKLAELLLGRSKKNSPLLVPNNESLNPLHAAAIFDTPVQLTRILMDSKAGSAASAQTTSFGATALHLAVASSRVADSLANVEALVTRKACRIKDGHKRTPLVVAVQNKKTSKKVVKTLLNEYPESAKKKFTKGQLPIHLSVQSSRAKYSVVRALIKAYPDGVKALTKQGNTPLHEACASGAPVEVIELLVKKYDEGLNIANKHHEVPLDRAQATGASKKVITLLNGRTYKKKPVQQTFSDFSADFGLAEF